MDTLENEQTLLQEDVVTKKIIRDELESKSFDGIVDEEIEAKINDELKKYKDLATTFGGKVFQYNEDAKSIKVNENFLAKQEYLLCLYLQYSKKKDNGTRRLTEIFEKIVGESIVSYLGDTAKYKIVDKSGINLEEFCKDDLMEKSHPTANRNFTNEKNIPRCDLIAWKPLDDRSGKLILLVQCKSGKHWKDGLTVNLRAWMENLIDFAERPVTIYAITDLLNAEDILAISKEKGLIFDRARIISMLAEVKNNEIQELRNEIEGHHLETILEE